MTTLGCMLVCDCKDQRGVRLKTADSAECVRRVPCNPLAADRGKVLLLPSLLCRTFQDQGHVVVIVGKRGTRKHGWEGEGLHRKRRYNPAGRGLGKSLLFGAARPPGSGAGVWRRDSVEQGA